MKKIKKVLESKITKNDYDVNTRMFAEILGTQHNNADATFNSIDVHVISTDSKMEHYLLNKIKERPVRVTIETTDDEPKRKQFTDSFTHNRKESAKMMDLLRRVYDVIEQSHLNDDKLIKNYCDKFEFSRALGEDIFNFLSAKDQIFRDVVIKRQKRYRERIKRKRKSGTENIIKNDKAQYVDIFGYPEMFVGEEKAEVTSSSDVKIPDYVSLDGTSMRLRHHKPVGAFDNDKEYSEYWRDAGEWGVGFKIKDGKLVSVFPAKDMKYLHEKELIEITKEQYEKDNEGYLKY